MYNIYGIKDGAHKRTPFSMGIIAMEQLVL